MTLWYVFTGLLLFFYSYGFRDPNLPVLWGAWEKPFMDFLTSLVFINRSASVAVFLVTLFLLSVFYFLTINNLRKISLPQMPVILVMGMLLSLSYPALTHDLFNYMTTAKVLYHHGENPYLVMPVEIPSEPNLAFTRAANKVALYGPAWLVLSAVPHFLGQGNLLLTILSFKAFAGLSWVLTALTIYRLTGSLSAFYFFALNPLIIIEILVSGHNDLWMMLLLVWGIHFFYQKRAAKKIAAWLLILASALVKGASLAVLPLFTVSFSRERFFRLGFWVMLGVFLVAGSVREEAYPWYFSWSIVFAALLSGKDRLIKAITVILSVSLELRHLPYLYSLRYDGYGPFFRLLVTVVPAGTYLIWYLWKKYFPVKKI